MELKHLHLASRDHQASQRFYGTYFGFQFEATFARAGLPAATILRAPTGFQIYLEAESSEPLPAWFHFGFLVESAGACIELHERMQRDQVRIVQSLVSVPFASYFFADPDGHHAQVYFDPKAR